MTHAFSYKSFLFTTLIATICGFLLYGFSAQAASDAIFLPTKTEIGINDKPVLTLISDVTKFLAGLLGALTIIMIVISGIMYITSGGDSSRLDTAKSILVYSIIGLVVALLAWVIVATIAGALGAG